MPEPMTRRSGPAAKPVGATPLHRLVVAYVAERRAGGMAASTAPARRRQLLVFADSVAGVVGDVTRRDVERFVGAAGLAPGTRRRRLSDVRTFWAWLVAAGHATGDPTAGVGPIREPRRLPRQLRAEQVDAIVAACPDARARLIVHLELDTGLRAVEVARLRVDDVDLDGRTMLIRGKGGHERLLPIPRACWSALGEYLAEEPAPPGPGPLIRSYNDPSAGLCAAYVVHLVGKIMRAAGVADGGGHRLRHTMAGGLVRRGVHLRDVQAILGHDNLSTTSRYLPTNVADLALAIDAPDADEARHHRIEVAIPSVIRGSNGVLIATVAALAATVARIEARLAATAGPPPARPAPRRPVEKSADHPHTSRGNCRCPWCGSTWVWCEALEKHMARPHEKCPDCDRQSVNLAAHRRKAHPWAVGTA